MRSVLKIFSALLLLTVVAWLVAPAHILAQGERRTYQLSGIIVDGDSSYGVPGVHVYIKNAGLGTVSNPVGFFTMPVMVGDTVVFSAVGFKKQNLIAPQVADLGLTVLIDLQTDTTFLPVIEVFPYPTKEIFKEAFLALELPDDQYEVMRKNLDRQALTQMAMSLPMSSSENYRFYSDQRINHMANRNFATSFSFMNPFAWAEFIRSVKRGDLKKDNWKRD